MNIFIYMEKGNKLVLTDEQPEGSVFTEFINVDRVKVSIKQNRKEERE